MNSLESLLSLDVFRFDVEMMNNNDEEKWNWDDGLAGKKQRQVLDS